MVTLSMDLSGLAGFFKNWDTKEIAARAERAMERTLAHIVLLAKVLAPRDTGRLAAAITYDVWGSGYNVWGKVLVPVPYAHEREYGRPPGAPLIEKGELLGWMGRKNIPETAEDSLRWSIHVKGSPPTPFIRPAVEQSQEYFVQSMIEELFGKAA